MMHVAMVTSTPIPPEEGIGYYTTNLSKELQKRGHDVTIVTRGGLRGSRTTYEGVRVRREPFVPVYPVHVDLHGVFVNRRLRQLDPAPDIIHAQTPLTPVIDVATPVVSTIHTSVVEDAARISSLHPQALANKVVTRLSSKRLINNQAEVATELTTVAHSVKEELDDHFGITDVHVVGNGVDLTEFNTTVPGTDESYALFVGRLSYRKGLSDLVDAWKKLPDGERIPLKIVGKGPLRDRLEEQIRQADMGTQIEMLGHVPRDELVRLYRQATLFVVPSHYEGLPTVLLEAMAARTAVVATAVSGALDVIDHGENGLLVSPQDPTSLRDAIRDVLDDAEFRDELATAGRETVERNYTWTAVTDRFLDIYESVTDA